MQEVYYRTLIEECGDTELQRQLDEKTKDILNNLFQEKVSKFSVDEDSDSENQVETEKAICDAIDLLQMS